MIMLIITCLIVYAICSPSFEIAKIYAQFKTEIALLFNAQNNDDSQPWSSEKDLLNPLKPSWNQLSDHEKRLWLKLAKVYPHLPIDQQHLLYQKMLKWSAMSAQERKIARSNFLLSQHLSEEQLVQAWQDYQKLTQTEKEKLLAQSKTMKPSVVSAPPSFYVYQVADTSNKQDVTVPAVKLISPTKTTAPLVPIAPNQAMSIYHGS